MVDPRLKALTPGAGRTPQGVTLPDTLAEAWVSLPEQFESPSSIVSYLECPLKWFVDRHLEGLYKKTGETILGITTFVKRPPNQWAVGGTLTHRALEVFYSEPAEYRTRQLLGDIFDHAWECLVKDNLKDGIIPKSLHKDYNLMLAEQFEPKRFVSQFRSTYRQMTLQDFVVENPSPPSVEVIDNERAIGLVRGRMRVRGKIDRLDLTFKGGTRVVDYKTGKSPSDKASVFSKTFLPSGIYALAIDEVSRVEMDVAPPAFIQLLYLKDAGVYNVLVNEQVLGDVEDILGMVSTTMEAIGEKGEVPFTPAASAEDMPCKWCPLLKLCPAWG